MFINNFDSIRKLLEFTQKGDFYVIDFIKRRKDNGNENMPTSNHQRGHVYIYNIEQLYDIDIVKNTRCYINLNKRNDKRIAMETLRKITDLIISEQYHAVKDTYHSCSGKFPCTDITKRWVIDIDDKTRVIDVDVNNVETTIPTVNGYHIITTPFNTKDFKIQYPDIDINKDGRTLLYFDT